MARYREFCLQLELTAFPISVYVLRLWIESLHQTCRYSTIINYLAAIGDYCRTKELEWGSVRMHAHVVGMLEGIRRDGPRVVKSKVPLSEQHMRLLYSTIDPAVESDLVFWAIASCSFFGLLRLGEAVRSADARRHIPTSSLMINSHEASFLLPQSKTDQGWQGVTVRVPRLQVEWCPVRALECLYARFARGTALFSVALAEPPTREQIMLRLRRTIGYRTGISGHSFRAGGASWLAASGQTELTIKRVGRWTSDAWRTYVNGHPHLARHFNTHPYTNFNPSNT